MRSRDVPIRHLQIVEWRYVPEVGRLGKSQDVLCLYFSAKTLHLLISLTVQLHH
jgi:hypothetical protein